MGLPMSGAAHIHSFRQTKMRSMHEVWRIPTKSMGEWRREEARDVLLGGVPFLCKL